MLQGKCFHCGYPNLQLPPYMQCELTRPLYLIEAHHIGIKVIFTSARRVKMYSFCLT